MLTPTDAMQKPFMDLRIRFGSKVLKALRMFKLTNEPGTMCKMIVKYSIANIFSYMSFANFVKLVREFPLSIMTDSLSESVIPLSRKAS